MGASHHSRDQLNLFPVMVIKQENGNPQGLLVGGSLDEFLHKPLYREKSAEIPVHLTWQISSETKAWRHISPVVLSPQANTGN